MGFYISAKVGFVFFDKCSIFELPTEITY